MRLKKSWEVVEEGEEKSKGGGGRGEEVRHEGGEGVGEGCWSIADEEEGKSLDLSADCLSSSPLQQLILCLRRKSASHSS